MQDGRKAVWSIPYVSVAFFQSLKPNFIAYRSSKVSDCIFEIHQLRQSGFCRVYSNSCCSCSFELAIINIGQSSHNMYSNNILNFQESTTILNAHTKKSGNLSYSPRVYIYIYIYISVCVWVCVCVCVWEREREREREREIFKRIYFVDDFTVREKQILTLNNRQDCSAIKTPTYIPFEGQQPSFPFSMTELANINPRIPLSFLAFRKYSILNDNVFVS